MDCNEVREKLFAYLDGEAQDDVEHLEKHFKLCLPCFKRVTLEKAFLKVIRARSVGKPVPPELEQKIKKEISGRGSSKSWLTSKRQPLLMLAAACLMVTAVGFTAFDRSSPGRGASAAAGTVLSPAPAASVAPAGSREGSLDGTVVCINCVMGCRDAGYGVDEHCNGIMTADGRIWHIVETESTDDELIHNPAMRGKTLHVDGLISPSAQAVAVSRYRY